MKNCPKDDMMRMFIAQRGKNGLDTLRPVKGFRGYYMYLSTKPVKIRLDGIILESPHNVAVIATSNGDCVRLLKPWRAKKNGKPYGAWRVALQDNNGKRKYFKLHALSNLVFADKWIEANQQMEINASQEALGELF